MTSYTDTQASSNALTIQFNKSQNYALSRVIKGEIWELFALMAGQDIIIMVFEVILTKFLEIEVIISSPWVAKYEGCIIIWQPFVFIILMSTSKAHLVLKLTWLSYRRPQVQVPLAIRLPRVPLLNVWFLPLFCQMSLNHIGILTLGISCNQLWSILEFLHSLSGCRHFINW